MNDNDFRQFNGSFDSAMDPDSAFMKRLQQRMAAETPRQTVPLQSPVHAPLTARDVDQPATPRRSNRLYTVAAVLVVFSLAFASVMQLAPRVIEPQYASDARATLPASTVGTPGPDVTLNTEKLPVGENVGEVHLLENSLIAVTFSRESGQRHLVSYDIDSGEEQWRQELPELAYEVFGDETVVGISYRESASGQRNGLLEPDEMVGYDIYTGKKLWTTTIARSDTVHEWINMVIAGDTVVLVLDGELIAINVLNGETRWQADYDLIRTEDDEFTQPPTLAQVNGELYVGQIDGSVEVLDLASGALVRKFGLPTSFGNAHPVNMLMFIVPAGLLVTADTYVGSGALTTMMVVDPTDGTLVWEMKLDEAGRIHVASDGSIAVSTYSWENPPLLLRLLGRDGYSTSALAWVDADGEVVLETDPIRVPDMSPLVVATDSSYACITLQEFTCFDKAGTRYIVDAGNVWNATFEADTLLLHTDTGVYRVQFP